LKKIILTFFILIFAAPIYAGQFKLQPTIKKESVTIEELISFLDIDMFKYKLILAKGNNVTIVFKDIKESSRKSSRIKI